MQSDKPQGARAKTSTPRTSSTTNEVKPQQTTILMDEMDCNIREDNQPKDDTSTQTWTSNSTPGPTSPSAPQAIGNNNFKRKRSYAGHITNIRIFPDQQTHQYSPPHSEAQRHDLQEETRKMAPWTPHQTYDSKGCADFHENSEGVVLTSPSGHPYCSYCRITSHKRSNCRIRSKDLSQNIDRLYHPAKGIIQSNNQRRRCNKDEPPTENHSVAGTSKIRTASFYTLNAVSPVKHFHPPNDTHKFLKDTDTSGVPNFWSIKGQLIVSHTGHTCCSYCGIPSHSREKCKQRTQDEANGKFYNAHPNRGKILSKNQSAKQLQPTEGASYRTFKKQSYYEKDRAQTLQSRSRHISEENDLWDFNQNTPFLNNSYPTKRSCNDKNEFRPNGAASKLQPDVTTPNKPTKHRAKWAVNDDSSNTPQNNKRGLSDMPAEILERILSHLSFSQRSGIQRTNNQIQQVTLTPKLWKNITIRGRLITNPVMFNVLKKRTTSLDIPDCVWRANPQEEIEMENYLILNAPKLTYLGLQGFGGNNALVATLILLSTDLATLDLSEADFALLSHVLNKINRTNHITAINLSIVKKSPQNRQPTALYERYSPVRANIIADLTTKCIQLTDLVLMGTDLSQDSIVQICHLVTPTLVAINLARECIKDEHVDALTKRCPNMKYINLSETKISCRIFPKIATRWKYSMRDLSLPESFARQLKLFSDFGPFERREEFQTLVSSMPRMERLHVGHYRFHLTDVMYRRTTVRMLSKMFPKLLINPNPFGTLGPSSSDPGRKFKNNIRPTSWATRD